MNYELPPGNLDTISILKEFGFRDDRYPGQVTYDFRTCRLSAVRCMNLACQAIVLLTANLFDGRELSTIELQSPQQFESPELCAAWIAWHLDRDSMARKYMHSPWLDLGRAKIMLLPWVRRHAEFLARPHCSVAREWVKLAIRTLQTICADARQPREIEIGFDGKLLVFTCGDHVVPMPASGKEWPNRYAIPVAALANLPKRLRREYLDVGIFEGHLEFCGCRFQGAYPLT